MTDGDRARRAGRPVQDAMEAAKKLLQRDCPADALPYFKALRELLWAVEREQDAARKLAEFGEKTGASPWT